MGVSLLRLPGDRCQKPTGVDICHYISSSTTPRAFMYVLPRHPRPSAKPFINQLAHQFQGSMPSFIWLSLASFICYNPSTKSSASLLSGSQRASLPQISYASSSKRRRINVGRPGWGDMADIGRNIYMVGVGIQLAFVIAFLAITIMLHRRLISNSRSGIIKLRRRFTNWLLWAVYVVLILIVVSCSPPFPSNNPLPARPFFMGLVTLITCIGAHHLSPD